MLIFLAILSLASAASLHDHRFTQILPSSVQYQTQLTQPIQLVQVRPAQTLLGLGDTVQYVGQSQYGLEPNRQRYSVLSVEPKQSVQNIQTNGQQLVLTSVQPNIHQQYSIQAAQPQFNHQQLPLLSVQQNDDRVVVQEIQPNDQQVFVRDAQQNDQRVVIRDVQPNDQRVVIRDNQNNDQRVVIRDVQPNEQRVVIRDVQPNEQRVVIRDVQPNDQRVVISNTQQNDQRVVVQELQPNDQRVVIRDDQRVVIRDRDNQNNDQRVVVQEIKPNDQRIIMRAVQPIEAQRTVISQLPLQQNKQQQQQVLTLVEDSPRNQVQNVRIESSVQPLQYSNLVQPLQYSNLLQPVQYRSPFSSSVRSGPIVGDLREVGRGGTQYSYFVRGSDLENQEIVNQVSQPLQYSSVPQVSSVFVQPSKYVNVRGVVNPQVRISYSNVNSDPRVVSQSVQDY